jgi:hypothetical protein
VTSKNNSEKFEDCRTPPPCRNKTKSVNPLRVILPNGETMHSTHTASLGIPELSEVASVSDVPPAMANNYLLSVGQLCNEGYYVTFKIEGATIFNHAGENIPKIQRDLGTGYGASTCARMNHNFQ